MGKKQPGLGAILKIAARGPERSSLFYYLYDNHDEIARASAGRRIRWEPMAVSFISLALTDGDGKPASAATARKTWGKVRKEVLKQRTLRATGMLPGAASRQKKLPADWRPSGFAQPNAPSPSGGVHPGSQMAALAPALPMQPDPSPSAGIPLDASRPAGGSIHAAWQKANLRSGLSADGEPLHKRS